MTSREWRASSTPPTLVRDEEGQDFLGAFAAVCGKDNLHSLSSMRPALTVLWHRQCRLGADAAGEHVFDPVQQADHRPASGGRDKSAGGLDLVPSEPAGNACCTTAMHLLRAGIDITIIALWLGHEIPVTTHGYVAADLKMKECALAVVEPPLMRKSRYRPTDKLLKFLESLQRGRSFASSIGQYFGRLPFPIPDFRQIFAVFLDVFFMFNQLAHQHPFQLHAIVTRLR